MVLFGNKVYLKKFSKRNITNEYVGWLNNKEINKYSSQKIYINLRSNSDITEINIEDDGNGYPKEILSRIGEPYLTNSNKSLNKKSGLGLGIFIGKTLLEKNFAVVKCKNSDTRKGAEVSIKWKNKDLFEI